ncbi:MAG: acyltransferase [Planctomycetota bacterium]
MGERFVHPSAVVAAEAVVGEGTRIWHFCHVMAGARLGDEVVLGQNCFVAGRVTIGSGCRIQNNVSLYDGVILEEDVFVGPSVVFTNVKRPRARFPRRDAFAETRIGAGATLGANATIVCGVRVGRCAMVGAGAVVTSDVADHALVVGAPARPVGWVCRCGEALAPRAESRLEAGEGSSEDRTWGCSACGRRLRESDVGLTEIT